MHLKSLHIKNFKSHADTEIEFGLITSITGRNDCGKTNILRALKMLLHHTDWPAGWIKYGEESATITLTLMDGTVIERTRTIKSQSVKITKNGVIKDFTGKKDAAQWIENAVGIRKVTLDEATGPEDLNFVDVHEGPYLIGGRSDTVQRKVAGIVGANKIDDARTRLIKRSKKLENKLDDLSTEIQHLSPSISRDKGILDSCTDLLHNLDDLDKRRNDNQSQLQNLKNIRDHINQLTTVTTDNVVRDMSVQLEDVKSTRKKLEDVTRSLENLKRISFELSKPTMKDRATKGLTQSYNKLQTVKVQFLQHKSQLSSLFFLRDELDSVNEELVEYGERLESLSEQLEKLRNEKQSMLESLGVCPLCGNEI